MAIGIATVGGAAARPSAPQVRISPNPSLFTGTLTIRVNGLKPDETVRLLLSSKDGVGRRWRSSATFRATRTGTLDTATARSLSGSYVGVQPMGLLASLLPVAGPPAYYIFRSISRFELRVQPAIGASVSTAFSRSVAAPGVHLHFETLSREGFIGQYWVRDGSARRPAVLDIGGSGCGYGDLIAPALADSGFPTLDIAYCGEPGLPKTLSRVPLEYFARALNWLAEQPDVNPARVYVLGGSYGSEAALLLGVHYPSLVHGVVASSPSNVAHCNYPGCNGPAWTFDGKAVPYTYQANNPDPYGDPAAIIPVENIRGPIFLDCGGDDGVWLSCLYARAIMRRLHQYRDRYTHLLLDYPNAGHDIAGLVPYAPGNENQGGRPEANQLADLSLWPKLLSFLGAS